MLVRGQTKDLGDASLLWSNSVHRKGSVFVLWVMVYGPLHMGVGEGEVPHAP